MLKAFMASALILGSTFSISAPVAAQTLIQDSTYTTSSPVAGQNQESAEATSYQKSQRRGAYVCTRDRNGYLNLRTGPSLGNRIIGRIYNGRNVTILSSSGNWYKVRYRGRIGWVSGDFVCRGSRQRININRQSTNWVGYVCTRDRNGSLNLRQRPSTRSRILARIPNGFQFRGGHNEANSFVRFQYKGIDGWVSLRYLCFY